MEPPVRVADGSRAGGPQQIWSDLTFRLLNTFALLERVTCPTLIVEPDEDRIIPNAQFAHWLELLPNARLEQVSGQTNPTGHGLIMQEPERAAEVIGGFIQEVEG